MRGRRSRRRKRRGGGHWNYRNDHSLRDYDKKFEVRPPPAPLRQKAESCNHDRQKHIAATAA
eukprot:2485477-Pyramimonas_sp.AAC.1